jgi:hypothetical protein
MTTKADIETTTVIGALWVLHDRTGHWPTAERIADFLEAPLGDVLRHLRTLRRKRIFEHRQRRGERVWLPWEKVH